MNERAPRRSGIGLLCILITLLCWSSVPLFLKYFTKHIDGWTTNGWRYGVSAMIWLPLLVVGGLRSRLPKGLWRAAVIPSLANGIGQLCFAWTPYFINPGLQTFLLRLQIIFIAIGTYLVFPAERSLLRTRGYWIGVVIVFFGSVGIALLATNLPSRHTLLGIALALAAGVGFGAYSLSVRYYMGAYHPVHAFAVVSCYTATGLIVLMVIFGARHGLEAAKLDFGDLGLLLASAMLGIAFSHVLYYVSLNHLGVATSSGVILLQPVIVSIGSFFLYHERLTIWQWMCGLAAIGGAGIMLWTQRRLSRGMPDVPRANAASPRAPCGEKSAEYAAS